MFELGCVDGLKQSYDSQWIASKRNQSCLVGGESISAGAVCCLHSVCRYAVCKFPVNSDDKARHL